MSEWPVQRAHGLSGCFEAEGDAFDNWWEKGALQLLGDGSRRKRARKSYLSRSEGHLDGAVHPLECRHMPDYVFEFFREFLRREERDLVVDYCVSGGTSPAFRKSGGR